MMQMPDTEVLPVGLDPDLKRLSWPPNRLGTALEVWALRAGLRKAGPGGTLMPDIPAIETLAEAGSWLEWAAARLGAEAEAVEFSLPELEKGLIKGCPLVVA